MIDNTIKKTSPLTEPLVVRRTVDGLYKDGNKVGNYDQNGRFYICPGEVFNDVANLSTSLNRTVMFDNSSIVLEISLPAGTKGVYVDQFGGFNAYSQQEYLLDRHSSFVVSGLPRIEYQYVKGVKKEVTVLPVTLIPQSQSFVNKGFVHTGRESRQSYYNAFKDSIKFKNSSSRENQIGLSSITNYFLTKSSNGKNLASIFDDVIQYYRGLKLYDNGQKSIAEHGYDHVEDVLLYSMYLGSRMNFSETEMDIIINAAMLHDVSVAEASQSKALSKHGELGAKKPVSYL